MDTHRFRDQLTSSAQPQATGFIACPAAVLPQSPDVHGAWQELYRRAFEQAQAANRPSRLERLTAALWN